MSKQNKNKYEIKTQLCKLIKDHQNNTVDTKTLMKQLDQIQNTLSETPNGMENRDKDGPLPRVVPKIHS